jgi:hypothetical protein
VPSICGRGQSNKIVASNIVFLLSRRGVGAVLPESTCLQQLNFTARKFRWHWPLGHISGGTQLWDSGLGKGGLMY